MSKARSTKALHNDGRSRRYLSQNGLSRSPIFFLKDEHALACFAKTQDPPPQELRFFSALMQRKWWS